MAELNIAFWNVENLFHHETGRAIGRGPQSPDEYQAKLDRVARVICDMFSGAGPDLIGLAEVHRMEECRALQQLLNTQLNRSYLLLWEQGGHWRNTGLGILAAEDRVTRVRKLWDNRRSTFARPSILGVACNLRGVAEPIILVVNHWKSRMPQRTPGAPSSAEQRLETARWLGDHLQSMHRSTCVVNIGDFNAEPMEPPFNETHLRCTYRFSTALWTRATPAYLYNTAWRLMLEPDFWEDTTCDQYVESRPKTSHATDPSSSPALLDHLMVSGGALRGGPVSLRERTVRFHVSQWTSQTNTRGVLRPRRWSYQQAHPPTGASDHFPLVATFSIDQEAQDGDS